MMVLGLPVQANAAFPGQNGKIAFHSNQDGDYEIYSINPDGTGLLKLTNNTVNDFSPNWSPDGDEILFSRTSFSSGFDGDIWKMNADGSGQTIVVDAGSSTPPGNTPSWSPDGQQFAFSYDNHCDGPPPPGFVSGGVHTANADGSNVTWLTCGFDDGACCTSWSPDGTRLMWSEGPGPGPAIYLHTFGGSTVRLTPFDDGFGRGNPDWSPSGHKIIFTVADNIGSEPTQLYTMNPDGSGQAPLRLGSGGVWSPDGQKIAFNHSAVNAGIFTANADGSGETFVVAGFSPNWQPIPINSYPRPKGATPFYGSLTIAYEPCAAPDRTHGPPLVYGSCSSPQMTSDYLTVGTGDSTFKPARNEGYLRMGVVPGILATPADEADVTLQFFSDDIFTKAIDDYTGELRAKVALQITDKDNTPHPGGPGAATTTSIPLELTVGCTPVADPLEGSSCTASTSADALAPGTVKEGRRSIWGLGRVEVYDGGVDGDAQTPAGDTLFATQGLFVP